MTRLTVFTSDDVLAKRADIDASGQIRKTASAQMYRGTYSVYGYNGVDDYAALIDGLTTRQAFSHSLPIDGSVSGRITTKKRAEPGAKARSKAEFAIPAGPSALFIDHDAPDSAGGMSRDEFWRQTQLALPGIEKAGVVWRPSGSSHIYQGDIDRTGLRGQHFFVLIADGSDGPRVIKILAKRFWLAGFGKIVISKSGSLLERQAVDTAPTDAARLVFGGAECGPGLHQETGGAVVLNRGGFWDTRAEVVFTAEEQARYEAWVEQEKAKAAPMAAVRLAEHRGSEVARRLPELMQQGASAAEAEQRIGAAVDAAYGGTLLSDFQLTAVHDDGRHEAVTVGQVLADRDRWHEVDTLDPVNPGHRGGAPDCRLFLHGTSPIAYSLDDSGIVFRLRAAQQRLVVAKGNRGELVSQIAVTVAADPRVFGTDAGPVMLDAGKVRPLTVDRLINLIGSAIVLVVKTAKGESPTDINRETAILVLAALAG